MRWLLACTSAMLAVSTTGLIAVAQQRNNVTSYLQQGYRIINSTMGGMNLVLVLQKDSNLVLCEVVMETGQTTGCQTIK
jgi:hypothetical protein